jgi:hypothetical protein
LSGLINRLDYLLRPAQAVGAQIVVVGARQVRAAARINRLIDVDFHLSPTHDSNSAAMGKQFNAACADYSDAGHPVSALRKTAGALGSDR